MRARSIFPSSTLVIVSVIGATAFICGLIIGLPVLGWWLWPVQWTDIPQTPLATYTPYPTQTPYPTYTPFPTSTPSPLPPTPTPAPDAIVMAPTVNVLEGPGQDFAVVGQAGQAEELRVVGQYSNCAWLKVTTPTQVTGWVAADTSALRLQKPCDAIPQGTFRPATGNLKSPSSLGDGQLSVENGTAFDGVVALASSTNPNEAVASAYVRSGEIYLLVGIPDGVYVLFFASGSEWNGDIQRFMVDEQVQRFEDTFEYTTTAREYTIWEVTLQPEAGGTARTDEVPPDQFPAIKTATLAPTPQFPPGLVYIVSTGQGQQLWFVGADGQAQRYLLVPRQNDPTLSPNRQQVLYAIGYEGDMWLGDLSTGHQRNLTNTPDKLERDFQWWPANPDLVVFHFLPADDLQPSSGYLATISTDGTNYQVLDNEIGSYSPAALSPDGQAIAYDRGGAPWLYTLSTGPEPIAMQAYGLDFRHAASPEWSPDGQRLAWKVYGPEPGQDGWSGVAVFDLHAQTGYLLHRYTILAGSEIFAQLAWSPDGNWLAVVNQAEISGEKHSLWVIRVDGSEDYHLGNSQWPVWSPDGDQLAFWYRPPGADSYVDSRVMLVKVGEWRPHPLDLPLGARAIDWDNLQP